MYCDRWLSDHEAVLTKSLIQAESCPTTRRHIYLWSKANFNYIRQSIQSLCEEFVSSFAVTTPVSTLWNEFSKICNHCLSLIPSKWSTTKQNQPWITHHIKQLSRKKQRAYNRARLTKHASDWSTYLDLKRLSQHECRVAFNKYVSNFIDGNNNVTKKLWSFVKNRKQDHVGIGPLEYQDTTVTDSLSKANVLTKYFSSVFTNEDTANVPVLEGDPLPEISPIHMMMK